ncbi:MAG: helix-turn-helix domain-containing protein [Lachnospiraceae bacterium]|jgi:excisionase family DNA binding protein|nr:helix-turn-helix domain-containing protein [uncultured Acetatifactor sp.]MDE7019262.1 helix-turn-helix domain-containing protein [Lachnospiraceae bacterium]
MFESYPDVVRPQQLEDMLQIGRTKLYGLLRTGQIPNKRIGANYFIRKDAVIAYLEEK